MSEISAISNNLSYPLWKWRILHKRRTFLSHFINIYFTVVWIFVHEQVLGKSSLHKEDKEIERDHKVLASLPFVFVMFHACLAILCLTTKFGQNLLHTHQGKRYYQWCMYSSLLALVLLLWSNSIDSKLEMQNVIYATITVMTQAIFHHVGITQTTLWAIYSACMLFWIVNMAKQTMSASSVLTLFVGFFLVYLTAAIQELEYRRNFDRHQDRQEHSQSQDNIPCALDLTCTLASVDSSMAEVHAALDREGTIVLEKCADNFFRWNPEISRLLEERYLTQALYYAIASEDLAKISLLYKSQFSFFRVCAKVFSVLESTLNCSLPLFYDDNKLDVFINASQDLFEIMIFLLIYDYIRGPVQGMVTLSFVSVDGSYSIVCRIVTTGDIENSWFHGNKNHSHNANNNHSNNNNHNDLTSQSQGSIPYDLLIDDMIHDTSSPRESLLRSIVSRCLNCQWEISEPLISDDGLQMIETIVRMPINMVSMSQNVSSSSTTAHATESGSESKSCDSATSPPPLSSSILSSSVQSSVIATPLLPPLSPPWIFVNELAQFAHIKSKLRSLGIPHDTILEGQLKTRSRLSHVVVITEKQLLSSSDTWRRDLCRIALACIVVEETNDLETNSSNSEHSNADANTRMIHGSKGQGNDGRSQSQEIGTKSNNSYTNANSIDNYHNTANISHLARNCSDLALTIAEMRISAKITAPQLFEKTFLLLSRLEPRPLPFEDVAVLAPNISGVENSSNKVPYLNRSPLTFGSSRRGLGVGTSSATSGSGGSSSSGGGGGGGSNNNSNNNNQFTAKNMSFARYQGKNINIIRQFDISFQRVFVALTRYENDTKHYLNTNGSNNNQFHSQTKSERLSFRSMENGTDKGSSSSTTNVNNGNTMENEKSVEQLPQETDVNSHSIRSSTTLSTSTSLLSTPQQPSNSTSLPLPSSTSTSSMERLELFSLFNNVSANDYPSLETLSAFMEHCKRPLIHLKKDSFDDNTVGTNAQLVYKNSVTNLRISDNVIDNHQMYADMNVMHLLSRDKRHSKIIADNFLPLLRSIRSHCNEYNWQSVHDVCHVAVERSLQFQQRILNVYFHVLQELAMFANICLKCSSHENNVEFNIESKMNTDKKSPSKNRDSLFEPFDGISENAMNSKSVKLYNTKLLESISEMTDIIEVFVWEVIADH